MENRGPQLALVSREPCMRPCGWAPNSRPRRWGPGWRFGWRTGAPQGAPHQLQARYEALWWAGARTEVQVQDQGPEPLCLAQHGAPSLGWVGAERPPALKEKG